MRFTVDNQDQIWHVAWVAVTDWCREHNADDSKARAVADAATEDWVRRITERPECQRDAALDYTIMHAIREAYR